MFAWVCIVTPLILLSFLAGLPWGAIGVASGYAICIIIITIPQFSFALKYSPISVRDVFSVIYQPLALSVIVALAMTITRAQVIESSPVWITVISLATGAIVFMSLARGLSSVWTDVQEILDIRQTLFRNR